MLHRRNKGLYAPKVWTDTDDVGGGCAFSRAIGSSKKVNETTDEWTKIDKSRYDGTCAGCGNKYKTNEAIYVCNGKYFDSTKCVSMVYTDAQEKGGESSTNNTPSSAPKAVTPSSLVRCANCGDMVDHVTHIIRIGNAEIDLSICDDCDWLRRASWQLKLNGMWKPTPKREGIP